ncbi:MAG: DUF5677 domain-containing protein [Halobacteriota archaeon]|nr:DUF5677 domain-containing protein [Halobacteriota archaeon]
MKILQDIFDSQIQEQISFHQIVTRLIEKKCKEQGVTLAKDQLNAIEDKLRNLESDTITISFDEQQMSSSGIEQVGQHDIDFCIEMSDSENDLKELAERFIQGLSEQDCVFEILTRLHARACQTASEVLVLLESGHADGAHARWRSLHEIAVVGFFVKLHGNAVAERYLLHDGVESYKAAVQYQEHCSTIGYEPLSQEEFDEIEANYRSLINRFGTSYKSDYGWAASALGKERPTFRDIEEEAGLDHLRPFYKLASHNVHANPKGVFFKHGLYPNSGDILLAGPSNTGLADPSHGTAISLGQITVALITIRPNIDRLVACEVLIKLGPEIGKEFLAAQKSLENQEAT